MSTGERDTHFLHGFAHLLFEDFEEMLREDESDLTEVLFDETFPDRWRAKVEQRIARRAYDLVYHALFCSGLDASCWPGGPETASDIYRRQIARAASEVPDLAAWPEEGQVSYD